jgi:hypothetical protein
MEEMNTEIDYKTLYQEKCKEIAFLQENIKNKNTMENTLDDTTPFKLFGKTISTQYKKQQEKNIWIDCNFELVDLLKNDHSGKVGENFLHYLCDCNNIDNQYVEDINSKDGVYDIKILNKKIEIKTARLSQCGSFQHENLRNEGCDYYVFLDITPRCIYITILPSFIL